jgi:hypothetical protein
MRILLSLTVVLAAMATFTSSSEAQFGDGYRFGSGLRFTRGFCGGGFATPREQPPYFAQYPPVYYSGIVKRPYGISPYAVPPGIAPVEMSVPQPITVTNPFFEKQAVPVSGEASEPAPVKDSNGNKVTWRPNPYMETLTLNGSK